MKAFPVVLVAAALCVQRASSLWCYKCDNAQYHKDCKQVQCSDMNPFCVTSRHETPGQPTLVSKWCSPTCPQSTELKGSKINVHCCRTDYCNGGVSSIRGSYVLLGVALLASSFYILRMGL